MPGGSCSFRRPIAAAGTSAAQPGPPSDSQVWGPQICSNGQSGTYITYYNNVPTDFPNGDQLCNGWIRGVVGYACATIIA
jgi:hypothetical protein